MTDWRIVLALVGFFIGAYGLGAINGCGDKAAPAEQAPLESVQMPQPPSTVSPGPMFPTVRCVRFKMGEMPCVYCGSNGYDQTYGGPTCDWSRGAE